MEKAVNRPKSPAINRQQSAYNQIMNMRRFSPPVDLASNNSEGAVLDIDVNSTDSGDSLSNFDIREEREQFNRSHLRHSQIVQSAS